ncbi:MAG: diacylglycerol/lipid kinase family protein, partial [Dehalococcoidia bacterium]
MGNESPLFIVNPASGGGRTARRWPRLAAVIEEAGLAADAVHTEARGHGTGLAAEAIRAGRTLLVAVGGDGTTNEVASAVLAAGAGDDVRLATIGMGTGKDIAKCLGVGNPRQAIRAIADGSERRVDAGRVICRDASGESVVRFFL